MTKKLYRCPICGEVLTEEEYLNQFESGGSGYCYCEFSAINEKGEIWYPRILHEYEAFVREEQ